MNARSCRTGEGQGQEPADGHQRGARHGPDSLADWGQTERQAPWAAQVAACLASVFSSVNGMSSTQDPSALPCLRRFLWALGSSHLPQWAGGHREVQDHAPCFERKLGLRGAWSLCLRPGQVLDVSPSSRLLWPNYIPPNSHVAALTPAPQSGTGFGDGAPTEVIR